MNRIDAGNFSRRFVGVSERPSGVATERDALAVFASSEGERGGANAPKTLAQARGNEEDEPSAGRKRRVERNEFFDVESKTIVTIGKYEKRK